MSEQRKRNFYGRRSGKTLRPVQRKYMAGLEALVPAGIRVEDNPERVNIDTNLFGDKRPLWLEVGFGGGEHLVHQAANNPDVGIIGCEPFVNGVAMMMGKIHDQDVSNLRIYPDDVRDLFEVLPDACLDKAFLLYPDPWPKSRHNRRRFVNPEFIDPMARILKSGAIFRVATDIEDYVRQTLEVVGGHPEFEWLAETASDWQTPWDDWISTRYEQKALREGRTPHYLTFKRV